MTVFILAYLLPFMLIVLIALRSLLHRTPLERCKKLFGEIVRHPKYPPHDIAKLIDAVKCEDVDYLKDYLRDLGRP